MVSSCSKCRVPAPIHAQLIALFGAFFDYRLYVFEFDDIIAKMKLLELKCKNCGAVLKIEEDETTINCKHCGSKYKLDDEDIHIKYDDMEQAGYDYERGRMRAHAERIIAEEEAAYDSHTGPKSKKKAMALCCLGFVGLGGIHDFYLGRIGSGIVKFLTLNLFLIGSIADLASLTSGHYVDSHGLFVRED